MEKSRRILKRRDFIRTGILGSAAISLPLVRLASSPNAPCGSGKGEQGNTTGKAQSRVYDIAQKYGAEFGAIKPVIRSHQNGRL
ncbi:MAG TPA: hypothetical protein VMW92_07175 [Candidatus Heimdallarchaeota archaeon]|nr:hypothetical protein [Candidatus Heimdallarchaeota archaeon]